MPQSFACLYFHLVFSTKHRRPLLSEELQSRLFDYFGGILKNSAGSLLASGGVADHVHLLVSLSRQAAIADTLRELKASSSGWIHQTCPNLSSFAWQSGYGAFTVSHSALAGVRAYLAGQKEHHRVRTFQEEFVELLRRHGLTYDERYLWD